MKLTNTEIKQQLINELENVSRLGFDSIAQAIRACLDHEDFAHRWDILDRPKLIGLIYLAKTQVWKNI